MRAGALELAVAAGLLVAIAAAAVLEGGVVAVYGGTIYAVTMGLALVWIRARGVDPLPRLAKVGLGLIAVGVAWQIAPLPPALRAAVAPGQARWMGRVAPEWLGDLESWSHAIVSHDVYAALDATTPWTYDALVGATATVARIGAIAPDAFAWTLGQLLAMGVVWAVGVGLARDDRARRLLFGGLLVVCVAEALFGLAFRGGPTTGIGVKQYYIGSATGTFVNRGHFAALLLLGIGAAWGFAASLFPLLPEEVRRHKERVRRSSHPPSVFEASGDRLPRLALLAMLVAVLLVAVVASQARGPLIGFAVAALAVGIYAHRRRKESFHLGIALGLPVVGGGLAVLAFGLRGAFGRFRGVLAGTDASVLSRFDLWRDGLAAWMDAPVFGAGFGGWQLAHGMHEQGNHLYAFSNAHNELVEILVEGGIVGALGWALIVFVGARGALRALATVQHDARTAAGIGAFVAVLAVLIQSLGDFPLHIPGVALPWALLGGVAQGALCEPARAGSRHTTMAVALVAAVLCGGAALADAGFAGTRDERLGERGQLWKDPLHAERSVDAVTVWGARARARVELRPFDPWAHAAEAQAEATLAWAGWRVGGPRPAGQTPEEHALRAELALARAVELRPRDPRLLLSLGQTLLRLSEQSVTRDAYRARGVAMLADAVARDGWRAEEAMKYAEDLPVDDLLRIADAVSGPPRVVARVRYALGRTFDRRGEKRKAEEAFLASISADETYAPPHFTVAAILRGRGESAEEAAHIQRFLVGEERPGGMEGWARLLTGDLDAARLHLRRAVEQAPGNRWAWEGLAEAAKRRGDVKEEREALDHILAIDPGHAAATARRAALDTRGR